MIARTMRFYGMSDRDVMQMPIRRFFVIHRAITTLQIEEEIRAIGVHHTGNPKERIDDLLGVLHKTTPKGSKQPMMRGGAFSAEAIADGAGTYEAAPGSIAAERERQKANAARMKAEWEAKKKAQAEGQSPSPSVPPSTGM